ncbi:hypothetical protein AAC387_Pa08g2615 [Persea americana]
MTKTPSTTLPIKAILQCLSTLSHSLLFLAWARILLGVLWKPCLGVWAAAASYIEEFGVSLKPVSYVGSIRSSLPNASSQRLRSAEGLLAGSQRLRSVKGNE